MSKYLFTNFQPSSFGSHTLDMLKERFGELLRNFVNLRDELGKTPLYYATMGLFPENAEFLLANAASVSGSSQELQSLLAFVNETKQKFHPKFPAWVSVFEKIVAAGADLNDPMLIYYSIGTPFFPRCLVICRRDHRKYAHGQTLLDIALEKKDLDASMVFRRCGFECERGVHWDEDPSNLVERIACGQLFVWSTRHLYAHQSKPLIDWLAIMYLADSNFLKIRLERERKAVLAAKHLFDAHPHLYFYSDLDVYVDRKAHTQLERTITTNEEYVRNFHSANPFATLARPHICQWSLYILRRFALDACIGLAHLRLPALITTTILQALLDEKWPNITEYHYDQLVVAVKHFRDAPSHPTKRYRTKK